MKYNLKKTFFLSIYIITISLQLFAQTNNSLENIHSLKDEILKMDSLLFNVAFNQCNLELFKSIISDDIEFYDDRSGFNNSKQIEINAFIDKCSKTEQVTRKLNHCTIDKLGDFGAVQLGEHTFLVNDIPVEKAKFITIWEHTKSGWVVKRVVSFEHKPYEKEQRKE